MSNKIDNLIIPAYLNQRIVFDLIAMLQDGLSTVTRITSVDSTADKDRKLYGAAFGLNQALSSLLKIDVSGRRTFNKEKLPRFNETKNVFILLRQFFRNFEKY